MNTRSCREGLSPATCERKIGSVLGLERLKVHDPLIQHLNFDPIVDQVGTYAQGTQRGKKRSTRDVPTPGKHSECIFCDDLLVRGDVERRCGV